MARLITKFKYLKPEDRNNFGGYAEHIAAREGVVADLQKVSDERSAHTGNVWTAIVSLRREDAERLGFDTGARWRDMLRSQTQTLSENLRIPMSSLRWFAAFHNESHHPHVHLIAYSINPSEGYLSEKGVMALRSSFAQDIFAQDLLCECKKQAEHRDALKAQSREVLAEIMARVRGATYDNPQVEELLQTLAKRLAVPNGKKQYGYLRKDIKEIIDNIVDEIGKDGRIAALYNLWYESKESALKVYTEESPERVLLSQNKEFKSVKNLVITEAMKLSLPTDEIEEPEPTEPEYEPTSEEIEGADIPLGGRAPQQTRQHRPQAAPKDRGKETGAGTQTIEKEVAHTFDAQPLFGQLNNSE